MSNHEEWNEFLDNIISRAISEHRKTKEHECLEKRYEEIDEFLSTNFTLGEKTFLEEIMFEIGLSAEYETEIVYKKGIKDCVFILKQLGVLL